MIQLIIDLVFAFFFLAIVHFILESVLLPVARLKLNARLLALLERLDMLKAIHIEEIPDEVYQQARQSILCTVAILPTINYVIVKRAADELHGDPKIKGIVAERIKLLESCSIAEVQEITNKANDHAFTALLLNSAGQLMYLFPIAIVVLPIFYGLGQIADFKRELGELLSTPENDVWASGSVDEILEMA